jgi:hypothetical protein
VAEVIADLIDGVIGAAWTAAAGFFKTAERERDEWLSSPGVTTYAPKLTRRYQPWPSEGRLGGDRPYQPWPGGER